MRGGNWQWAAPAVLALGAALAVGCASTGAQTRPTEAQMVAEQAYVYGYPLVLMEMVRRSATNVETAGAARAPMNRFAHPGAPGAPDVAGVVRPDADTLWSVAWVNLSTEPIILHAPNTQGRYYAFQMLDAWTNVFACPGKRTTGAREANFALVGPGWGGKLPPGMRRIKAPTNLVWIIGRVRIDGPDDLGAADAIRKQFRLTPLSRWGAFVPVSPEKSQKRSGVDTRTPAKRQVEAMEAEAFFSLMTELMKANPPAPTDAPILSRMASIGLKPGEPFEMDSLNPVAAEAIRAAVRNARAAIAAEVRSLGSLENGWRIDREAGAYGVAYMRRAAVAFSSLGANLADEVLCAVADADASGVLLDGKHRYIIHLSSGTLPPVHAFWSVAAYDARGRLVGDSSGGGAVGDGENLRRNADASIDIFIQRDPPSESLRTKWLRAPKGRFSLVLRLTWPKKAALDGLWRPPAVRSAGEAASASDGDGTVRRPPRRPGPGPRPKPKPKPKFIPPAASDESF